MILYGIIYVAIMFSFIYLIRDRMQYGKYFVWLIFICSWGCDTCAYCVGVLFGKHKMAPHISPRKTWEGFAGGVSLSFLLSILY